MDVRGVELPESTQREVMVTKGRISKNRQG